MSGRAEARLSVVAPGRCALAGHLGFESAPGLWQQGATLFGAQAGGAVELDLSGVAQADSAGLALLVAWLSRAQAAGIVLRYVTVPDRLLAIARISSVDSLLAG